MSKRIDDQVLINEGSIIEVFDVEKGRDIVVDRIYKSETAWKKSLAPGVCYISRNAGTEPPFSGKYHDNKRVGLYRCACCGTDLFTSKTKFESGTGWPSFFSPVSEKNIKIKDDFSINMHREEVLCARCDAHLGHVFDDGPAPTHKRFCMNSASLVFIEIAVKN